MFSESLKSISIHRSGEREAEAESREVVDREETQGALAAFRTANGGDLARILISRAEPVGQFTGWKSSMTVTQFAAVKS